ncbi:MAG: nitroreductase [Candidatus Micrarchaeota archaeon]|nr:nitroreductase [Candidatus Micrarchaeota archaeon]
MELSDAINNRRAVREFTEKPVPKEIIAKLLHAGAMAPSAMDAQPCHYIVISNKSKIRELSDIAKDKNGALGLGAKFAEMMKLKEDVIFHGAPLVIFIVAEKSAWNKLDCALSAQNMMLQAHDLGLGSCFIGLANSLNSDRKTLHSLGMKSSQEIVCPLIFGYPKAQPHEKTREPKIQNVIE